MSFAKLIVDCSKIKHNINHIKSKLPNDTRVLLVAKADAYGLGAIDICNNLISTIDYIGVATFNECLTLRENNIETPILLLSDQFG